MDCCVCVCVCVTSEAVMESSLIVSLPSACGRLGDGFVTNFMYQSCISPHACLSAAWLCHQQMSRCTDVVGLHSNDEVVWLSDR